MSKPCRICSSPQNIQDCVIALRDEGTSHRKIEAELKTRFDFTIASSSIGHHLNTCLKEHRGKHAPEEMIMTLEALAQKAPDNEIVKLALRKILAKTIVQFDRKMIEETQDAPFVSLEIIRGLEILVNIMEKISPKAGSGDRGNFAQQTLEQFNVMTLEEKEKLLQSCPA